jgi:hypothetical protein
VAASFFQVIQYRSEFEDITRDFSMSVDGSCIDTIEWFLENGHRSNSLRNGFDRAKELALAIKEYADGCTKEIGSWESIRTF